MAKPFYRKTEPELAAGALNLVSIVTASPADWGLTAGEVTSYSAKATGFNDALTTARTPATRTRPAIEAKNIAKKILMDATIDVARTITAVATVSDAQLLELGLNERPNPQPRPVPEEPPVIEVVSVIGRIAKVRIHDGASESRKKPLGAIGANIYSFVGVEAPTDPRAYHYEGLATRATFDIEFDISVPGGATIWLSAQWVSARGQMSVGSTPIPFTLQGGATPAAA